MRGFSWEVELPEKTAPAWKRRRATVTMRDEAHGEERALVPCAVGRRLAAVRAEQPEGLLSREDLLALVEEASAASAHARMEALVNRRDLSAHELAERLSQDGYDHDVVSAIVARSQDAGIIDDARYARAFARSKALSGWGRTKVEYELSRRGIDVSRLEGWDEEGLFSRDEELERARSLAARKRLTGRNDYEKIVRFLTGRGFSFGLSSKVARERVSSADDV